MTERTDQKLSTADMAAAAERQTGQPVEDRPATTSAPAPDETQATALFATDETQRFRDEWDEVQTGFVDEPRRAVERADELVAQVMKRLAEIFAGERSKLESQWSRGGDVSTEDLRLALRRYRSFFDRLLTYGGQAAERPASAPAATRPPDRVRVETQPSTAGGPGPGAVEQPSTDQWEEEMPRYRASWEQQFGSRGENWEADEPYYRYAWETRHNPQYRDRPWPAAEPELRQDWEQRHPDTPWDRVADKIRAAWENTAPARGR